MTSAHQHLDATQRAELDALEAGLAQMEKVRAEAAGTKGYCIGDPWPLAVRRLLHLNPQAYGTRFQNYFAAHYGWDTVPSSLGRGDVVDADGNHWEVKVTAITPTNRTANFVQIRPHQHVGYRCFVIDADRAVTHFALTAEQMADEVARAGSNAHGTADALRGNRTREYALHLNWNAGSEAKERWLAEYLADEPPPR